MRALALPLVLAALMAPVTARADVLVGLAAANELVGVNLEFVGDAGSFYMLVGAYQSTTGYEPEDVTGMIGFRRYQGGEARQSGYFAGFFAGDIDGGPDYTRYGGGAEVGYQWVWEHLRVNLQMGLGLVGESSRGPEPGGTEIEPLPVIGAGLNLRF